MHIDPWILTFSAATVIVTIWMGFWSAKKSRTASDFFVAGRSVSVGWNASAISGEYLSAASFMGVAGMVMSSGYDALWYPVCYACGYLFLLLFIAGPLRRFGAYTIPDFAEGRYDSPLFRKIAVCFVLFIGFFYTMPQMKGAGTTLAYIFPGLPYWAGVVLVGAVITLNVALGGMKGITLVQAFQYWAKMFAISVPIFVLMAVYGHYGKQLEMNSSAPAPAALIDTNQSDPSGIKFIQLPPRAAEPPGFLDRVWPTTGYTMSGGPLQLTRMLKMVQSFGGYPNVYLSESLLESYGHSPKEFAPRNYRYEQDSWTGKHIQFSGGSGSKATVFESVKSDLAKVGLTVVEVSRDTALVVPTAEKDSCLSAASAQGLGGRAMVHRGTLPERAPADATWLSPFGPLTTKAAKAAAAGKTELDWSKRSRLSDPLPFVQTKPNLLRDLDQFTERFGSRQTGGLYLWNTNEPLWMILTRVKSAAGLIDILCDTNLLLMPVASDLQQQLRAAEYVSFVETKLKEQGVSIIRASRQEWWAVSASQAASYFRPVDTKPFALLYTYSLIIALVCGTAGLPHILVRFYTNPDGVAAKRTTMWVMILIGIFYVFPPVFGVMGRNLLPELYSGIGAKGTDKVVLELPRILNSDSPTHSLTGSPEANASGSVSESVSGKKRFPWGSVLSGITCAGAFAAFMSTFSGLLVSMTGALAHDVYGRMLRPKSTPEQRMRMFRIGAVMLGTGAIVAGSFVEPLQINFMVGQAFAIAAASYFPLLFMSAWWRGMTMKGAATGMLTGGLCALIGISLTSFTDLGWLKLADFWAANPLLRILCEQPAIWTVPLAITLMVIVSKLTRADVPSDIRMKMLVLHAPEKLGLKQEYIQEHQHGH